MKDFFWLRASKWQQRFFYALMILVVWSNFSSCKPAYHNYYFKTVKKDTTLQSYVSEAFESKIRPGDLLSIAISSLNPTEDVLFNLSSTEILKANAGYLVDKNGNIEVHKLGTVHVEGLTIIQVKDKLKKDLAPYLRDVIVDISFVNHRITLLGEVIKPQQLTIDKLDKISLLDALAASGDVTQNADRTNILVIRNTDSGKVMKRINLEDHSIFSSPWFYLKPDDIVYIPPDDKKFQDDSKLQRRQQWVTTLSISLSMAVLILDRIIK